MNTGIPQPSEYAPHFAGYIAAVSQVTNPLLKLEDQLDELVSLLADLDPPLRLYCYAPGKWSVQQLLGHIIDAERIFACRALRIARADQTPLPGFEENGYVTAAEADSVEWSQLIAEFAAVRRSTVLMLQNLPAAAWTRMGVVNGAPTSARAMVYVMAGHLAHHLNVLRERYLLPALDKHI
jgi:hypothetical protein